MHDAELTVDLTARFVVATDVEVRVAAVFVAISNRIRLAEYDAEEARSVRDKKAADEKAWDDAVRPIVAKYAKNAKAIKVARIPRRVRAPRRSRRASVSRRSRASARSPGRRSDDSDLASHSGGRL